MSQTERILYIDRQLGNHKSLTIHSVSMRYEISERQVKRDIEYLRDRFNAPIVYDSAAKTYRYEKAFDDLKFADQKIILFYVLAKSLLENDSYIPVYSNEVTGLIAKDVPKDYGKVCGRIIYQLPHTEKIDPEYFDLVCAAIRDKMCLDIVYSSIKNEETERCIEPEYMVNYGGSWYLIGNDSLRGALRTFHISRIKRMSASSRKAAKHSAAYEKELQNHIGNAFGIFKGRKTKNVVIRFYDYAARIVESQIWHEKQKLTFGTEKQTGTKEAVPYLEMSLPVVDFREILGKILSFGANAYPVQPPELYSLWQDEITKMSKALKKKL